MSIETIVSDLRAKKEKLEQMIAELEGDSDIYQPETMSDVVERVKSKPPLRKFSTGIDWLDTNMDGGLSEATFINLAGPNFSGKTFLAMKIMENISNYEQVFFFSFEMYEGLLAKRVRHWSGQQLRNLLIEQKVTDLYRIAEIVRMERRRGVKFFVIDSRMKITMSQKLDIYEKNSEITRVLSKVTQETGATILLINQISESDLRSGRLSLKGSGDQAYDSDVILYIAMENDKQGLPIKRHYICAKDRVNERTWKHSEPVEREIVYRPSEPEPTKEAGQAEFDYDVIEDVRI